MSTPDTLNFTSQQINIYYGLSILILGVIGGILNIIIFTTLKTFRETSCAFYLTVVSIVNIAHLLTALLVRVLSEGFNTNIGSMLWVCKIQVFMSSWCLLVSMTVLCLATIDQYLSMSTYRHYSNKQLAQRGIVLSCLFWGLYGIPVFIYYGVPFGTCICTNPTFAIYIARVHFPVFVGFLPLTIMTAFSLLAFYNARTLISRQINIVRLSRDRQLTAMTLFHAVFVVITTLPYTIFFIYFGDQTSKDPEQIARNNLIFTITILVGYSSFTGPFYIYYCVSKRFRKQLLYVLMKICIDRRQLINNWNNNQIIPNLEMIESKQSLLVPIQQNAEMQLSNFKQQYSIILEKLKKEYDEYHKQLCTSIVQFDNKLAEQSNNNIIEYTFSPSTNVSLGKRLRLQRPNQVSINKKPTETMF